LRPTFALFTAVAPEKSVTGDPGSAGTTRPRSITGFPYVATLGPLSVSLTDVIVTDAWAVVPSAPVAVTVAMNRPGP
jgi:hypothetical protein